MRPDTVRTEVGAPPVVLRDVYVNHEQLVFRGPAIDDRSFVREIDAAHWQRPSRFAAFVVKNAVRRTVRVDEASWIVNNFSAGSWYHWLAECLPRLLHAGPDTLLLPRLYQHQPYVPFTLQAFPEVRRVGWIGLSEKAWVARLTFLGRHGATDGELRTVAARVAELAPAGTGSRRVYLTRRNAARRRLVNERDAAAVFERHGFETVTIDPADPAGQIRAVRDADILAGVHGADLANLMFLRPGAKLLELRHPVDPMFNGCYRQLAAAAGVDYSELRCELARPGAVAGWDVNFADLAVDVDRLDGTLARLG